jgi:hypothetical protein
VQREEKDLLRPDLVAQPARSRDPDRKAEKVSRDHPLERAGARVEHATERRQGDVDDRDVHQVHEDGEEEAGGDKPLVLDAGRAVRFCNHESIVQANTWVQQP